MAQKTYWHLLSQKRMPTEYEIVTSKLLLYTGEGFTGKRFELDVPLQKWYQQYQEGSPFTCSSWEKFVDPRETTYTRYTEIQLEKEIFVDGILEEIEATNYDASLPRSWLQVLERFLAPLRFPVHGLQMAAAYLGQMAPGGRLTIAASLQAADEVRRVERLAYRQRQLQITYPEFAQDGLKHNSKAIWQDAPIWQPLREVIERLLVTYDWAESFTALNLVIKPLFDQLFMVHFSDLALSKGDHLLGQILYSLNEDCQWHREWSQSLVKIAIQDKSANRDVLQRWVNRWSPLGLRALDALSPALAVDSGMDPNEQISRQWRSYLNSMDLDTPSVAKLRDDGWPAS
jgi:toluene monooxygenase system protein E